MSIEDQTTDPLQQVLTLVRSIDSRLTALEQKVDERRYDTRPIWEQVLQEMKSMQKTMGIMQKDIYGLRSSLESIEERIERLEVNPNAPTTRI
ncbi:MAG TPA: hypothetical protein VFC63_03755 [Blastocatellia bacterium]|nr:hypothetical protein [Blastocatellia bacterium]